MKLFYLTGKKAIVVGGAGGIGQAIAQGVAEAGAKVMITSRSEDSLKRARDEIKAASGMEVSYCACDATKEEQVELLLKTALEKLGGADILINAQGLNLKYPGTEFPVDEWDKMFDANVKSVMLTCKHFGKYMKENHIRGKIVNLSSVCGIRAVGNGGLGNVGYCATKGAVEMLTKAYASDLGPDIQVNAIGPTVIYTPMMAKTGLVPADPVERNAKFASATPAKRLGYPEDCVGPTIFLASAASDFVTGQTIYPDGGRTAIG